MPTDCLALLKELLGHPIPQTYLNLLADYPAQLLTARRAIDDSTSEGVVAEAELLNDLHGVLAINIEVRQEALVDPDGVEYGWPPSFLVIGETGGGDYYCIDVESPKTEVMQYDHHAVEWEIVADSLGEFVEILTETFLPDE